MRVVLTKKMVIGHVMRYPGELVELPEAVPETDAMPVQPQPAEAEVDPDEVAVPAPLRRRKKPTASPEVASPEVEL